MQNPVHYHYGKFPPDRLDWDRLVPLIGPANAALAKYDGTLSAIPNAAVLLSPLMTQEAVFSSRLEGTQASMGEVLQYEAEGGPDTVSSTKRADFQEVINYRRSMYHAISLLETLPLCQRLVRETHRILMEGARGSDKSPGNYRKIQNHIGPAGCSIDQARFIPISVDKLLSGMKTWEKYIHTDPRDRLTQIAVLHAEFEALHPFLDGNGRIGRLCIPLFMSKLGLIESPMFYISEYFEANREEYAERLLAVSRDNDWNGWCEFFLNAVTLQAEANHQKAKDILSLYESKKIQIIKITRSQYAIHALDFIFSRPIFRSSDFTSADNIPRPTALRIIKLLKKNDILLTIREASGRRSSLLAFTELLNLAEGHDVFV